MKSVFKALIMGLALSAAVLMPNFAKAQSSPKPAVVISIAKMTEQLADAKYLVDAAGFGQMAFLINVQADQFLKGIDNDKAAGVLLFFEEENPMPKALGFVPVKNLEDVLDTIANNVGEIEEGDDYVTVITDSEQEILIKESGGYAFLSDNKEMFSSIPENPGKMLGDLPTKYNFSAKVFGQRIPESLRGQAIEMIREGYEAQLQQMEDMGEDLAAGIQQGNLDFQMKQIESMIHETDNLVIGFSADKETKSMYFDMEMIGLEGSMLAKRCEATANGKPTRFSGFVNEENSAFNMNTCFSILPDDAKNYKELIAQMKETGLEEFEADGDLSDEDLEKIEGAMDVIIDVLNSTLDAGIMDGGAVARIKKGDTNIAMGAALTNPQKIETLVKENISLLKDALGEDLQVKLNSGSHQGVNMHTLVVSIPEEEEETIENFGDQLTIVLGIGKDTIYAAAGNDPYPTLKEAMDRSKSGTYKSDLAMQWNVYLAPFMKFAAGIENNEMAEIMGDKLEEAGNDRLGVSSWMTNNGMKLRFDMEDGILKLIQAATEAMGQGFGPDGDDF